MMVAFLLAIFTVVSIFNQICFVSYQITFKMFKNFMHKTSFIAITGGIVDLDGRIEVGDQIVQVNRSSFENLSDVEAVDLLRKAAASRRLAIFNFFRFVSSKLLLSNVNVQRPSYCWKLFSYTISGQSHFMLLKERAAIQISEQIYSQGLLQKQCPSIYHFGWRAPSRSTFSFLNIIELFYWFLHVFIF